MDAELYESNKHNENRRTIRVGFRWIFWRSKKDNLNEIFIVAFIHEIISITILLGLIVELIVSIALNIEVVYMIICFLLVFIYFLYCVVLLNVIRKKYKKNLQ